MITSEHVLRIELSDNVVNLLAKLLGAPNAPGHVTDEPVQTKKTVTKTKPVEVPTAQTEPEKTTPVVKEVAKKQDLNYEIDVQPLVGKLLREGHREAIKALLTKAGVSKASSLTADQLPDFLSALKNIG